MPYSTPIIRGVLDFDVARDEVGHRDYTIQWLVEAPFTTADMAAYTTRQPYYGPATILNAMDQFMPIGSEWGFHSPAIVDSQGNPVQCDFGIDVDAQAKCWPDTKVNKLPGIGPEKSHFFVAQQHFSTRGMPRCGRLDAIGNPLLEPVKIEGHRNRRSMEFPIDRFGNRMISPALEPLRGKAIEFEHNLPVKVITINSIMPPTEDNIIDHVNSVALWGYEPRQILCSNVSYTRQVYNICTYYYVVVYEFDINPFGPFDLNNPNPLAAVSHDRWIASVGRQYYDPALILNGFNPTDIDPSTSAPYNQNSKNFKLYQDSRGGHTEIGLQADGTLAETEDDVYYMKVEHYPEVDFLNEIMYLPQDLNLPPNSEFLQIPITSP